MLTMKYISIFFLALFSITSMQAQRIDEELGFIYVKADYLLETNRYEDAIKEFNKIVDKDATFKDVLYKRAYAKYMIAAFKGTKKDLLQSFDMVGITPESVELYGKALESLGQDEAASKTKETASMIKGTGSSRRTSSDGRDHDEPKQNEEDSTTDGEDKTQMEKIEDAIGSILDDLLPDREGESETEMEEGETAPSETSTEAETETEIDTGDRRRGDSKGSKTTPKPQEEEKEVYKPDMSVKEIFIDEDLTLEFMNGIGGFKIAHFPTILILSDSTGKVEVDVCVSANGNIVSADYNRGNSTIYTQSLISVALRKSKEFKFKNDSGQEICGTIVYKITGGN